MQAVILAGGLGTRLKPFTEEHPKPMIPIEGIPFIEYLIRQVAEWGIKKIVLLLGYKAEEIRDFLGNGSRYDVSITYRITPVEFDTGARIKDAEGVLEEQFLLMYCDNYCPIDYETAYQKFIESDSLIQICAYRNKDGYTKNNVLFKDNLVEIYNKKRLQNNLNAVDIGYALIKKEVISFLPNDNCNFETEVYPRVVSLNKMGCFITEHRYYSIGSWERIELTKEFFRNRKVVFLDRDGTINERPPKACYVEKPEDFKWLPNAQKALKLLKEKGYEIYLISNQPGIARGNLDEKMLNKIHEKMENDLKKAGVRLDGIYICPHNWDEGCECRKPKPGLIFQAQKEHSINLTKSVLIGDDERDIEAGKAAGVNKCFLINDEKTLFDIVNEID